MLLIFEEGIRGGISQSSHRYAEANNKYMKNYDKNKESSFLIYLDVNNFYGWVMSKKLPTDCFKWVIDVSKIDEEFIKNYDNDDDIGYELWYEYIKPKYDDNVTLCYTDTDSFIFHAKTEDFYEDIDNDVKKWFDTSNYAATLNRPVSIGRTRNKLEK